MDTSKDDVIIKLLQTGKSINELNAEVKLNIAKLQEINKKLSDLIDQMVDDKIKEN